MARKKKKGGDTRGYSTTAAKPTTIIPPPLSSSTTSLSTSIQNTADVVSTTNNANVTEENVDTKLLAVATASSISTSTKKAPTTKSLNNKSKKKKSTSTTRSTNNKLTKHSRNNNTTITTSATATTKTASSKTTTNNHVNNDSNAPKIEVSRRAHEELWNVLDELKSLNNSKNNNINNNNNNNNNNDNIHQQQRKNLNINSLKVWRKVSYLVDTLTDLKFNDEQIRNMLRAYVEGNVPIVNDTIPSISSNNDNRDCPSLSDALDWFCLNLTSDELPLLFTDLSVRDYRKDDEENDDDDYNNPKCLSAIMTRNNDSSREGDGNGTGNDKHKGKKELLQGKTPQENNILRSPPPLPTVFDAVSGTWQRPEQTTEWNKQQQQYEEKINDEKRLKEEKLNMLQQYQFVDNVYDDVHDNDIGNNGLGQDGVLLPSLNDEISGDNVKSKDVGGVETATTPVPIVTAVTTTIATTNTTAIPTTTTEASITNNSSTPTVINDTTSDTICNHPDDKQLETYQQEINEGKSILEDEAAMYTMDRHEIKHLKIKVRKLEKMAKGLQIKIQKRLAAIRAAAKEQAEEEGLNPTLNSDDGNDNDDDGKGDGGGKENAALDDGNNNPIDSLFASDDEQVSTANKNGDAKASEPALPPIPPPDLTISKSWTGKTPRTILYEYCTKRNWSKPTFRKLPATTSNCRNGCKVEIKMGKKGGVGQCVSITETGPFQSYHDAMEFCSSKVMYSIRDYSAGGGGNGGALSSVYRLFPSPFREIWKDWVQLEVDEAKESLETGDEVWRERIVALVRDASSLSLGKTGGHQQQQGRKSNKDNNGCIGSNDNNANVNNNDDELLKDEEGDYCSRDRAVDDRIDDKTSTSSPLIPLPLSNKGMGGRGRCCKRRERMRDAFIRHKKTKAYGLMMDQRQMLPIHQFRKQIIETVRDHPVTVLCAETGAGKTTQCPQFLLEELLLSSDNDATPPPVVNNRRDSGKRASASIICCQPRRVAAVSVAERVADEMDGGRVGGLVGYQVRMESRCGPDTMLTFCTTGVVLRRMQDDPDLIGVTHIVVDEVHERQWQIDFLLVALRRLIQTTRRDLKVILMSATMNSQLFCSFFNDCPFISVPGRTFPVNEYFLEDLLDATDHIIEEDSKYAVRRSRENNGKASFMVRNRGGERRRETISLGDDAELDEISDDYVGCKMSTRRSMKRVNEEILNLDLIEDLLTIMLIDTKRNTKIVTPSGSSSLSSGSILIFLPGMGEIKSLHERLKGSRNFSDPSQFDILPMHSMLSNKDQRRVFLKAKSGCMKIILATNIAETSVTISDCVCVIDSGLMREVRQNTRSMISSLVKCWCSKASSKQRSGRAGRVQPGICCKLYSSKTAENVMQQQSLPELQRVPLEEVCLSILAGRLSNTCMDFLLQAPQPPSELAVAAALQILKEVGAINISSSQCESLTSLGIHLAKLPVHPRLGKMLIFGTLFKVLDKVLTIAASLSSKSPFRTSFDDSASATAIHKSFEYPTSDFLTICNVWKGYSNALEKSQYQGRLFCEKNFLSRTALVEIDKLRDQFLSLLAQSGFVTGDILNADSKQVASSQYNINDKREDVLSAVICAGLYPNVVRVEEDVTKAVTLWHNDERVSFHRSSVNSSTKTGQSEWFVFNEKLGTNYGKISISNTSKINPFSLLLFGGSIFVHHAERKVKVDNWIELKVAAQTAVMFRQLRNQLMILLDHKMRDTREFDDSEIAINGIIKLLAAE